jgi:lipid-binding SYLF domain-containing protein
MKTTILVVLIMGLAGSTLAVDKSELDKDLRTITEKFAAMQQSPNTRIPADQLAAAKGIVLLDRTGGAFIIGGHSGRGVALTRNPQGQWSQPSFVESGGVSLGAQIGGTKDFFVMLANTPAAADTLKQSTTDLGAGASVTGGTSHAGTQANLESSPVVVYSQNKGLYAGASLKGGSMKQDTDANEVYYGRPVSAQDVFSAQVQPTPMGMILVKDLDQWSR